MPRDVNGNFTLDPSNPVVPGTIIETGWANPSLSDIASALTDSLSRTGSGGMLAPFKFTDGSKTSPGESWGNEPTAGWYRAATHDFRFAVLGADIIQVKDTGLTISTGKSFNAPIVTTPLVTTTGLVDLNLGANAIPYWTLNAATAAFYPIADNARDLGTPANRIGKVVTPIIDSGTAGALTLRVNNGTPVISLAAGGITSLIDGVQFNRTSAAVGPMYFNLANSGGRLIYGIEGSVSGSLLGGGTPFAGQFLTVGNTPVELGTANSIVARFTGGGAGNNILIFSAAGGDPTIAASPGVSVSFTSPLKANGGLVPSFESAELGIAAATWFGVAHGLGVLPKLFKAIIRCKTAELGYVVGDEVELTHSVDGANNPGLGLVVSTTFIGFGVVTFIYVYNRTTLALSQITFANWKIVLRAWK